MLIYYHLFHGRFSNQFKSLYKLIIQLFKMTGYLLYCEINCVEIQQGYIALEKQQIANFTN